MTSPPNPTLPDLTQLPFEAALHQLQTIVSQLESGDLSLDQSLTLYEQGQQLAVHCQHQLDQATLRIEAVTADGEIIQLNPLTE